MKITKEIQELIDLGLFEVGNGTLTYREEDEICPNEDFNEEGSDCNCEFCNQD